MRRSVTSKTRSCVAMWLLGIAVASSNVSGCAAFGTSRDSTVAQGKYYASGDPYYDEFFVDLYLLQVGMAEAPKIPEAERQRWIQLLQLEQQATPAMIELRLHEEALKLSRAGVHLRLDQSSTVGAPEAAGTTVRSNARPKENPAAALLVNVETSGSQLLHCLLTMKQKEEALGRLELLTIRLDAGVDHAFSQAPLGKPTEVKANLADAHKLIALMRERAAAVRASSEQLLAALTHGIDTDDGSIAPPSAGEQPTTEGAHETGTAADPSKKAAGKPPPKAKPASPAPASTLTPTPRPKPPKTDSDSDEPAKPRAAASKPAPPPRDFEP